MPRASGGVKPSLGCYVLRSVQALGWLWIWSRKLGQTSGLPFPLSSSLAAVFVLHAPNLARLARPGRCNHAPVTKLDAFVRPNEWLLYHEDHGDLARARIALAGRQVLRQADNWGVVLPGSGERLGGHGRHPELL